MPRSRRSRTGCRAARAGWSTSRTAAARSPRSTALRRGCSRSARSTRPSRSARPRSCSAGGRSWWTRARASRPRSGCRAPTRSSIGWPDDVLPQLSPGPDDAIVVLTHEERFDVPALAGALASDAFYIGALGSRIAQASRRERLLEAGVPAEALERLHGPSGLDLGAESPAETAVSILTEIMAARAERPGGPLRERAGGVRSQPHGCLWTDIARPARRADRPRRRERAARPGRLRRLRAGARSVRAARSPRPAYRAGARFVDVNYFDPWVKRIRIEHAAADTLDWVPPWYGDRVRGARRGARGHHRAPRHPRPHALRRPRPGARRPGPAAVAEGVHGARERADDQLVRRAEPDAPRGRSSPTRSSSRRTRSRRSGRRSSTSAASTRTIRSRPGRPASPRSAGRRRR